MKHIKNTLPHLFTTTWPTMSAAQNSFQNRTKGAYANNQHQLNAEIKENPRKTSFYRAIKLCVGVLLILDSDATPFTRSLGKKWQNPSSKGSKFQSQIAKDPICNKLSTRLVIQNFADS